jgi:hypothetical protein
MYPMNYHVSRHYEEPLFNPWRRQLKPIPAQFHVDRRNKFPYIASSASGFILFGDGVRQ